MKNHAYIAAKGIVYLFMAGALAASYTHIVHLFNLLGLHGWQAWASPAFVDGFALLGLLGRGAAFAAKTRRTGLKIQIAATSLSFVANVLAGESWGARIFGALVVAGYVIAEVYADQLVPAEADTAAAVADLAAAETAKRSAAAKKGAATRKANASKKVPAQRKARQIQAVA
jgi:hypothetical protein